MLKLWVFYVIIDRVVELTRNKKMDGNFIQGQQRKPTSSKSKVGLLAVALALIVLAVVVFVVYGDKLKKGSDVTTSEYQAVFLGNGQVYFGKLQDTGRWMVLTDVYYLQVTQPLQSAATGSTGTTPTNTGTANQNQEIKLVKLGGELHGPEDAMYFGRDQVLFWENMKDDSRVLEAIKKYQTQ
ncbi:MAG TPA: hypothetical protein VD998_01465 [Verrucomicrobiae bacterium]|nr:hypothetical protein [Verrucomicrobiae bacterium]